MNIDISFFKSAGPNKVSQILYSNKCYMCKTKFEDVLYKHGWNAEYLFHLKSTHALDPEIFFDILSGILKK